VFKHPLELLRTIVLPSTSQPPLRINDLNKHSTLQINQFLPVFLCYLILVFCSLFCYSSLIQQVCSVSYLLSFLQINQFLPVFLCYLILVFCSLFCYSSLIQQVCSVSYLLSFSLLLFCPSCCSSSVLVLHCSFTVYYSSAHLLFLTVLPIFHSERSTKFGHPHFLLFHLL
jgi:hypothetical protein